MSLFTSTGGRGHVFHVSDFLTVYQQEYSEICELRADFDGNLHRCLGLEKYKHIQLGSTSDVLLLNFGILLT